MNIERRISMGQLQVLFPVLLIFVFYFLLIRPQKKREKQINEMRNNLKVGDKVVTIGGINGKIIKIKDEKVTIEVGADKVRIEMMRWSISSKEGQTNAAPEKSKKAEEKPEIKEEKPQIQDNQPDEDNKKDEQ